jgi:hypothetical protein
MWSVNPFNEPGAYEEKAKREQQKNGGRIWAID